MSSGRLSFWELNKLFARALGPLVPYQHDSSPRRLPATSTLVSTPPRHESSPLYTRSGRLTPIVTSSLWLRLGPGKGTEVPSSYGSGHPYWVCGRLAAANVQKQIFGGRSRWITACETAWSSVALLRSKGTCSEVWRPTSPISSAAAYPLGNSVGAIESVVRRLVHPLWARCNRLGGREMPLEPLPVMVTLNSGLPSCSRCHVRVGSW